MIMIVSGDGDGDGDGVRRRCVIGGKTGQPQLRVQDR